MIIKVSLNSILEFMIVNNSKKLKMLLKRDTMSEKELNEIKEALKKGNWRVLN